MIVDSMSIQEITKAVLSEKEYVTRCSLRFKQQFKSYVLKSNNFPYTKTFKCKTPQNKTELFISIRAEKRGEYSNPTRSIYALYRRREGIYAAQVEGNWESITIFTPHFFSRYRERMMKDETISLESAVHLFFGRFFGYCDMWLDENQKQVFEKIESPEERVNLVGAYHEGLIFGFNEGNVCMAKTFVPLNMLYDDQLPLFNKLFDELKRCFDQDFVSRYLHSIETHNA